MPYKECTLLAWLQWIHYAQYLSSYGFPGYKTNTKEPIGSNSSTLPTTLYEPGYQPLYYPHCQMITAPPTTSITVQPPVQTTVHAPDFTQAHALNVHLVAVPFVFSFFFFLFLFSFSYK